MLSFQRVTVPLALTPHDAELLRYASLIADLGVSTDFDFVHVVTDVHRPADFDPEDYREHVQRSVEEHFLAPPDVECSYHVREGVRVDELLQFLEDRQSNLVVLGHRKIRSGARSLARRLAMIGPASVWLVPEGAPCRISRILAPIDFSENSADSLSHAAAIAHLRDLDELQALHVYFDPSTIRYDEHVDEVREQERDTLEEFLRPVNRHGVRITARYQESSNVANAILRTVEQERIDLLVMSTRGRSRAASILLGSATSDTMTRTPVPILVVKHFGARMSIFQALRDQKLWSESSFKTN
jgi:SulP family sulfate permease